MRRTRLGRALTVTLLLVAVGALPTAAHAGYGQRAPKRVLIVVLDQMRPDYVDRFDMRNVRALMRGGASFPRAILGHMAAETVISHNVITSGLFPKHMGWSNEVYRDVDNVLGEGPGAYFVTSSLSCDQFGSLTRAGGYPKLGDYLGGRFFAIGQKVTATCGAGQPAGADDAIVNMSSRKFDCDGDGVNNWRGPDGVNVPGYLTSPTCGRYYVDSSSKLGYGTLETSPAWMYPLDGNRYAVGNDPAHLGGDVWTADTAIDVMRHERDWRGMLVTMGSIDKMAHMWGTDDRGPSGVGTDTDAQAHLPFAARTADAQVGRLMATLDQLGLRKDTLVVLTADHAGQTAERFHGIDAAGRSDYNWYYGRDSDETYLSPSPALQPLVDTGNLDFSYQDGHIAAWLSDTSPSRLQQAATVMRGLPDVIASYVRRGSRYQRVGATGTMSAGERRWWRRHGQQLVDTMAAPYGPDVVGLLRDDTSYGVAGDHGGHQREIQEIPLAFSWPGLRPGPRAQRIRSVDILPTVLGLMGIAPDRRRPPDGRAVPLRGRGW